MHERHRGFVAGFHTTQDRRIIWSVRVKDLRSNYNGQKLVVASIQDGIALARGLNVHFAIGTVDDPSGRKVPRAVDVALEPLGGTTTSN